MKFGIIFISVIVLLFSSGCKRTVKYKTVNYYSVFDVDVPDYFKSFVIPETNAQFQIGDRQAKFYLTIFNEDVVELNDIGFDFDLISYSRICLEGVRTVLDFPEIIEDKEFKDNNDRKTYRISRFHEPTSEKLVYYLSFFKGKTKFYTVTTWCLESDKEKHIGTMKHIHSSFKEK